MTQPKITVSAVAAQQAQSKASKRATLDLLRSKKRRTKVVELQLNGSSAEFAFHALGAHELDALQAKHPPTAAQKLQGLAWNGDTFPPALVAACLTDPEVTEEEMTEMWNSGEWSTGELSSLFTAASNLCMEGMDIPFTAPD